MAKITSVDAYIDHAPEVSQETLHQLRSVILSTLPDIEEFISWNVPYYKYFGEVGGFAAYTKHATFGLGAEVFTDEIRESLEKKGYKTMKGTFQIRYDQKVPVADIKKMLKLKAQLNEANAQ